MRFHRPAGRSDGWRRWGLLVPLWQFACNGGGGATTASEADTSTGEATTAGTTASPTTGSPDVETTVGPDTSTSTTTTGPTTGPTTGSTTEALLDTTTSTASTTAGTGSTGGTDGASTDTADASTAAGSTDTGATTDTGGGPPGDCELPELVHAPAPTLVDGLFAVPIDILSLSAEMTFDLAADAAHADVTLQFQLGPHGGMPIFDLRQTIAEATLDGQPLDPALMALHDFGLGLESGFRILAQDLEHCSQHTLTFSYPVGLPLAPKPEGFTWAAAPERLYFDFALHDLHPGRYLEAYLPANMPYDRHPLSLGITMTGAGAPHTLITNADVDPQGEHAWQLEFPDTTTSVAPMVVIVPSSDITSTTGVHAAVNGQDIPYTVYRNNSVMPSLEFVVTLVGEYIDEFVASTGDYAHPSLTVYFGATRSVEYDGALSTKPGYLDHELFHNWWARGVHPATYADGWFDEAWTMYNTDILEEFTVEPFEWNAPPVLLFVPHPFSRVTWASAYVDGRRFFAGLAAILGLDALRDSMAELYVDVGPLGFLTTAQLERHLYCDSGELPEVRQAFWRFVHDNFGQAPPPPPDYCD